MQFLYLIFCIILALAGQPSQWVLEADLLQAVREGDFEQVVNLLHAHAPNIDPAFEENISLKEASLYGYPKVVKALLATKRVNPAAAIPSAIRGDHEEVMMLLLRHSGDVTVHDNIAIRWASRAGKPEMVEELLRNPAVDPSANGNEAIKMAASFGHTSIVKALLKHRKVDATADDGFALKNAAANKHWDTVTVLLESGKADHISSIQSAIESANSFKHDMDNSIMVLLQTHLEQAQINAKKIEEARAALIEQHEKDGTLSSLPECSICTDYILPSDVIAQISCHPYHNSCIEQWISTKRREGKLTTCPMCREPI